MLHVLGGKSFWKNFILSRNGPVHSTETKQGWVKIKNPTPIQNDGDPLSGLQRNAPASLVHFVTYITKYLGMQVHCVGGRERAAIVP